MPRGAVRDSVGQVWPTGDGTHMCDASEVLYLNRLSAELAYSVHLFAAQMRATKGAMIHGLNNLIHSKQSCNAVALRRYPHSSINASWSVPLLSTAPRPLALPRCGIPKGTAMQSSDLHEPCSSDRLTTGCQVQQHPLTFKVVAASTADRINSMHQPEAAN